MTANVEEARRARKQRRRKREAEDDFDASPKIFIGKVGRTIGSNEINVARPSLANTRTDTEFHLYVK